MIPVGAVLAAATFIAVYWPEQVQPDGGRGVLIGAGDGMPAAMRITSMRDTNCAILVMRDVGLITECMKKADCRRRYSTDMAKAASSLLSRDSPICRLGQSRHHLGICHRSLAARGRGKDTVPELSHQAGAHQGGLQGAQQGHAYLGKDNRLAWRAR